MIDFVCPNCGSEIHAQDSAAGKRGKCKSCEQVISVPNSGQRTLPDEVPVPAPLKRDGDTFPRVPPQLRPQSETNQSFAVWLGKRPAIIMAIGLVIAILGPIAGVVAENRIEHETRQSLPALGILLPILSVVAGIACWFLGKRIFDINKKHEFDMVAIHMSSPSPSNDDGLEDTRPIRSMVPSSNIPPQTNQLSLGLRLIGMGCGLAIIAPILLCGFLGFFGNNKSNKLNNEDKTIEAWTAAQILVTERLKSPRTADFGGMSNYQDPKTCVTNLGDRKYEVKGWVDSQNALGATLRTDFTLTIKDEQEEKRTWTVIGEPVLRTRL